MVSTDTVIGVVGAVVLAGAMVAVFYYESQNPTLDTAGAVGTGTNSYPVTWNLTTTSPTPVQGPVLNQGASQDHALGVPAYTGTVTVTLTWTDNDNRPAQVRSGADSFRLRVADSNGTVLFESEAEDDGTIEWTFTNGTLTAPTTPSRVRGNDTEEANQNLAGHVRGDPTTGADTWTVTVTLVSTGEQLGQLPGQTGVDLTNAYTLAWTMDHYVGTASG